MVIRAEQPADYNAIDDIHNKAFGHSVESALIRRLRQRADYNKELSLVAEEGGTVLGHVLFTPVTVESPVKSTPAIILAPLAVLEQHRSKGVGAMLVRAGIEKARKAGYGIMLVYGHSYYTRFGFTLAHPKGIFRPNPMPGATVWVLELAQGGLDGAMGVIKYPKEFRPLIEEWYTED